MIVCFDISVASSAYDEIRDSNILVLPSRKTLRDYRNAIRPKVGFNPDVINELKNVIKNLNFIQRFICLCFYEIKFRAAWFSINTQMNLLVLLILVILIQTIVLSVILTNWLAIQLFIILGGFVLSSTLHLHILQCTVLHLSR